MQRTDRIVKKNFTVRDVIGQSYLMRFTPYSEMSVGKKSPSYETGFYSRLVLKVLPDEKSLPVNSLTFLGNSPVKSGDYISAQIPVYDAMYKEKDTGDAYMFHQYKKEDTAIQLEILSEEGKVLRKDRAIDYEEIIRNGIYK